MMHFKTKGERCMRKFFNLRSQEKKDMEVFGNIIIEEIIHAVNTQLYYRVIDRIARRNDVCKCDIMELFQKHVLLDEYFFGYDSSGEYVKKRVQNYPMTIIGDDHRSLYEKLYTNQREYISIYKLKLDKSMLMKSPRNLLYPIYVICIDFTDKFHLSKSEKKTLYSGFEGRLLPNSSANGIKYVDIEAFAYSYTENLTHVMEIICALEFGCLMTISSDCNSRSLFTYLSDKDVSSVKNVSYKIKDKLISNIDYYRPMIKHICANIANNVWELQQKYMHLKLTSFVKTDYRDIRHFIPEMISYLTAFVESHNLVDDKFVDMSKYTTVCPMNISKSLNDLMVERYTCFSSLAHFYKITDSSSKSKLSDDNKSLLDNAPLISEGISFSNLAIFNTENVYKDIFDEDAMLLIFIELIGYHYISIGYHLDIDVENADTLLSRAINRGEYLSKEDLNRVDASRAVLYVNHIMNKFEDNMALQIEYTRAKNYIESKYLS